MLCAGALRKANGRYAVLISASPTIAGYSDGFALDSAGRLCVTVEAVSGTDVYIGGVRCRSDGVLRVTGSVPGASHYVNGYRFLDADDVLCTQDDVTAPAIFSNGDPYSNTTEGRLAIDST